MFKKKPNLKNVTTRELFAELAERFKNSDIYIYDIKISSIMEHAPEYINAGVMNRTRDS